MSCTKLWYRYTYVDKIEILDGVVCGRRAKTDVALAITTLERSFW